MSKKIEQVKLNSAALQFVDPNCFAKASAAADGEQPKLEMTVYSGGVIKDHWYWGNLAIDLQGMSFPKKTTPILEDHMTSRKIGFSTKLSTEDNKLSVAEATFIDTPESLEFRKNSAAGFPYEASMFARPTTIERVGDGDTAEVNGYTFKGPGTIWRKSLFKEASVCTFGYDPNTKSAAMSESDEEELALEVTGKSPTKEKETKPMTLEQFKAEHPELHKTLVAEITGTVEQKFTGEITTLTEQNAALTEQNTTLTEQNTKLTDEGKESEKRLVALEKAESVRLSKSIETEADEIFASKFSASELPERLQPKVRRLLDHQKFMKDGVLDTEAFGAAIDAELKDWVPEEGSESVLGFSSSGKTPAPGKFSESDADAVANRMLGHLGQAATE